MKTKLTVILALFSMIACKKDYKTAENNKPSSLKNVRIQSIKELSGISTITASGKLSSKQETVLSFKVGGIVKALKTEEGQAIQSGKVLAQLNLSEINAHLIVAENAYSKSERDLERTTNLYKDAAATLEQMQNAETAKNIAASQLEIATFNRQYSSIVTPITGHILKRFVEEGEMVSSGQPIYKIGSSGTKGSQIIRVGLSDRDIVKLKRNDNAVIQFDAFPKKEYLGKVSEIAQTSHPSTGLYDIEITLSSYFPELKNGFISKVEIQPSQNSELYKVPMSALVEGNGKTARIFYSLDKKTVRDKLVDVHEIKGNYFTISTNQLPKGTYIVTGGAPYLKNNDLIKVIAL